MINLTNLIPRPENAWLHEANVHIVTGVHERYHPPHNDCIPSVLVELHEARHNNRRNCRRNERAGTIGNAFNCSIGRILQYHSNAGCNDTRLKRNRTGRL